MHSFLQYLLSQTKSTRTNLGSLNVPRKKNLPTKPEHQEYATFLHGIKLIGLGLQECKATLNRDLYFNSLQKERSLRTISTDYDLLECNKEFFNVSATLRLSVGDQKNTSVPALSIDCKY